MHADLDRPRSSDPALIVTSVAAAGSFVLLVSGVALLVDSKAKYSFVQTAKRGVAFAF